MGNKVLEPKQDRNIASLKPALQVKCNAIMAILQCEGFRPFLIETGRSRDRQVWLWGYGRTHHIGQKVKTNVRVSKHEKGLAFDLGFKTVLGKVIWDNTNPCWNRLAVLAKQWGLVSGGTWKMHDCPHVETR